MGGELSVTPPLKGGGGDANPLASVLSGNQLPSAAVAPTGRRMVRGFAADEVRTKRLISGMVRIRPLEVLLARLEMTAERKRGLTLG